MKPPSQEYRDDIRCGLRAFDIPDSILSPGDVINNMRIANLEAAMELLGFDIAVLRRNFAPSYRPRHDSRHD